MDQNKGYCLKCDCCLTAQCVRIWGIIWSVVLLVLGILTVARGAFLALSGVLLINFYGDRTDYRDCGDCTAGWQPYRHDSAVCEADRDDGTYCWRRCCSDDAGWLLPAEQTDGALNAMYYGNFNSAVWLILFGGLLICLSLFHPKAAGGCCGKSPFWLLDPFTRVGGQGVLILFVAGSGGGGWMWFDRIFLSVFALVGWIMIILAIVDCFIWYLPQPLPLLACSSCCGCPGVVEVGGTDLEDVEGATDVKGDTCIMCQCGSCGFRFGSIFSIANLVVAILVVTRGALFLPGSGNSGFAGVYDYGLSGVAWFIGAGIVFVSLQTPKSLWFPLWFFDPLRSLIGLGVLFVFLGTSGGRDILDVVNGGRAGYSVFYLSFVGVVGIVYIVCGCINMWCAPSCGGCAGCNGVPEPYPLLAYLCTTERTCRIRCHTCGPATAHVSTAR